MTKVSEFISSLENTQKEKLIILLDWIKASYPSLKLELKWNQPMFILDGTFIISMSVAKNHISIAPEKYIIDLFADDITNSNYELTKMMFKIKATQKIDYKLFKKIIDFKRIDKNDYQSFWK